MKRTNKLCFNYINFLKIGVQYYKTTIKFQKKGKIE